MKKMEKNEMIEYLKINNESDEMIKYYLDRYYFYELSDGYIIRFDKKPSINKTLWFNDEYDIPELTEELFIEYNKRNILCEYAEIEINNLKPFLVNCHIGRKKEGIVQNLKYLVDYEEQLGWAKSKDYFIRYMTDEEIEEYNKICKELKDEYIERLKRYYKRYNKYICCSGYWVNR